MNKYDEAVNVISHVNGSAIPDKIIIIINNYIIKLSSRVRVVSNRGYPVSESSRKSVKFSTRGAIE